MAVRQDWTRFTRTIHDLLVSPHLDSRKIHQPLDIASIAGLQFVSGNVAVARDRKLLAEVERRKGQVLVNNFRNQLR